MCGTGPTRTGTVCWTNDIQAQALRTFKPVAAHGELSLDVLQGVLKVWRLPDLVLGTESSRFQKIRLFLTLGAEDVIHCKTSACLQCPSGPSSMQ
jgi:hypothetical protein